MTSCQHGHVRMVFSADDICCGCFSGYASSHNQDNYQKPGGHGKFDRPFSEMDADGDDSLSYMEFKQDYAYWGDL